MWIAKNDIKLLYIYKDNQKRINISNLAKSYK